MIAVELSFGAEPDRLRARLTHREVLAQLEDSGELVMAGPWDDDSGALLIFDVEEDSLDEILSEDPYYRTPGVTIASRRRWNPLTLH